jgi:hypothetical protein
VFILLFAYTVVWMIVSSDIQWILIAGGVYLGCISVLFLLKAKLKQHTVVVCTAMGVVLLTMMLKARQEISDELNFESVYLAGMNFMQMVRVIQRQQPSLGMIVISEILISIVKFVLLRKARYDIIIQHIFLILNVLIFQVIDEKSMRKQFESLFTSRESLKKFRELIDLYLPESVIIFSKNLKEIFFANQAFSKTFPMKDLTKNLEIIFDLKCDKDSATPAFMISKKRIPD